MLKKPQKFGMFLQSKYEFAESIDRQFYSTTNFNHSIDQSVALEYTEHFRRQIQSKLKHLDQLLLYPRNHFGLNHVICSSLSTYLQPFPQLWTLEGCVKFVADFLEYHPNSHLQCMPDDLPTMVVSPNILIDIRNGDSLDFSMFLTSILIGSGFDAYVVCGFASKPATIRDRTEEESPKEYFNQTDLELIHSEYETMMEKQRMLEEQQMNMEAVKSGVKITFEDYIKEFEKRKKEEEQRKEDEREKKEKESLKETDKFQGRRRHFWVLVKAGKREVTQDVFIEATTGIIHPVNDCSDVNHNKTELITSENEPKDEDETGEDCDVTAADVDDDPNNQTEKEEETLEEQTDKDRTAENENDDNDETNEEQTQVDPMGADKEENNQQQTIDPILSTTDETSSEDQSTMPPFYFEKIDSIFNDKNYYVCRNAHNKDTLRTISLDFTDSKEWVFLFYDDEQHPMIQEDNGDTQGQKNQSGNDHNNIDDDGIREQSLSIDYSDTEQIRHTINQQQRSKQFGNESTLNINNDNNKNNHLMNEDDMKSDDHQKKKQMVSVPSSWADPYTLSEMDLKYPLTFGYRREEFANRIKIERWNEYFQLDEEQLAEKVGDHAALSSPYSPRPHNPTLSVDSSNPSSKIGSGKNTEDNTLSPDSNVTMSEHIPGLVMQITIKDTDKRSHTFGEIIEIRKLFANRKDRLEKEVSLFHYNPPPSSPSSSQSMSQSLNQNNNTTEEDTNTMVINTGISLNHHTNNNDGSSKKMWDSVTVITEYGKGRESHLRRMKVNEKKQYRHTWYYQTDRIDKLVERVEFFGQFTMEIFHQRRDHLKKRVIYAKKKHSSSSSQEFSGDEYVSGNNKNGSSSSISNRSNNNNSNHRSSSSSSSSNVNRLGGMFSLLFSGNPKHDYLVSKVEEFYDQNLGNPMDERLLNVLYQCKESNDNDNDVDLKNNYIRPKVEKVTFDLEHDIIQVDCYSRPHKIQHSYKIFNKNKHLITGLNEENGNEYIHIQNGEDSNNDDLIAMYEFEWILSYERQCLNSVRDRERDFGKVFTNLMDEYECAELTPQQHSQFIIASEQQTGNNNNEHHNNVGRMSLAGVSMALMGEHGRSSIHGSTNQPTSSLPGSKDLSMNADSDGVGGSGNNSSKEPFDLIESFVPKGPFSTRAQAEQARDDSLRAMKERLVERLNTITARLHSEVESLETTKAEFEQRQMNEPEHTDILEEEFEKIKRESDFRIKIIKKRLTEHEREGVKLIRKLNQRIDDFINQQSF